jgi:hypothetical protein
MQRLILGLGPNDPRQGDHIDLCKLNNQRVNLRAATRSQNQHNKGLQRNNTSGFKGVCWSSARQKWKAQIKSGGKKIHLGLFSTPQEAHEAYKLGALKYHGEFANFG